MELKELTKIKIILKNKIRKLIFSDIKILLSNNNRDYDAALRIDILIALDITHISMVN
jgi:hypothetical protein